MEIIEREIETVVVSDTDSDDGKKNNFDCKMKLKLASTLSKHCIPSICNLFAVIIPKLHFN